MLKTSEILHYNFSNILKICPNEIGHVKRHEIYNGVVVPMHDHDYYEIQCGCSGDAIQILNGVKEPFLENEIYMLQPQDTHAIYTNSNQRFVYFNLAFEVSRLKYICETYQLKLAKQWMSDPDFQRKYRMSITTLANIRQGLKEMLMDNKRIFAVDRFLLNFLFLMERDLNDPYTNCPEWLRETIMRLDNEKYLQMGPRAMEKISGYSLAHISRVLKKHANMLPRDVMNKVRMEHAAATISLGTKDIYSIIKECGIKSSGYFFQLFKETYGCTPMQYRKNR